MERDPQFRAIHIDSSEKVFADAKKQLRRFQQLKINIALQCDISLKVAAIKLNIALIFYIIA